jgi:hypothetical protein
MLMRAPERSTSPRSRITSHHEATPNHTASLRAVARNRTTFRHGTLCGRTTSLRGSTTRNRLGCHFTSASADVLPRVSSDGAPDTKSMDAIPSLRQRGTGDVPPTTPSPDWNRERLRGMSMSSDRRRRDAQVSSRPFSGPLRIGRTVAGSEFRFGARYSRLLLSLLCGLALF